MEAALVDMIEQTLPAVIVSAAASTDDADVIQAPALLHMDLCIAQRIGGSITVQAVDFHRVEDTLVSIPLSTGSWSRGHCLQQFSWDLMLNEN